jgi:hypothetical protein
MKRVGKGTRRLVSWFGFREKCQGQDCWSGDVEEKTMEEEERESGWKRCVCVRVWMGMGMGYGDYLETGDWMGWVTVRQGQREQQQQAALRCTIHGCQSSA